MSLLSHSSWCSSSGLRAYHEIQCCIVRFLLVLLGCVLSRSRLRWDILQQVEQRIRCADRRGVIEPGSDGFQYPQKESVLLLAGFQIWVSIQPPPVLKIVVDGGNHRPAVRAVLLLIPMLNPGDLEVLHASAVGRIHTLIMRMSAEEATHRLAVYEPMLVDAVPLTLEEIFIYELGGADYAVKDIVL